MNRLDEHPEGREAAKEAARSAAKQARTRAGEELVAAPLRAILQDCAGRIGELLDEVRELEKEKAGAGDRKLEALKRRLFQAAKTSLAAANLSREGGIETTIARWRGAEEVGTRVLCALGGFGPGPRGDGHDSARAESAAANVAETARRALAAVGLEPQGDGQDVERFQAEVRRLRNADPTGRIEDAMYGRGKYAWRQTIRDLREAERGVAAELLTEAGLEPHGDESDLDRARLVARFYANGAVVPERDEPWSPRDIAFRPFRVPSGRRAGAALRRSADGLDRSRTAGKWSERDQALRDAANDLRQAASWLGDDGSGTA